MSITAKLAALAVRLVLALLCLSGGDGAAAWVCLDPNGEDD